jgi:aryl-alcohol dehydrogenase-like predicted oxidoreductase
MKNHRGLKGTAGMEMTTTLGKSELRVPHLGMGVMIWGEAKGLGRFLPAKTAYGGSESAEEEQKAFNASLAAGVNFFDTAAMYSAGASELRLGELARDHQDIVIASKFPGSFTFKVEQFPEELEASLRRLRRQRVDLYQHHWPRNSIPIPRLMELMADAVELGKIRAVGVSNYSVEQMRLAHETLAKRGIPLASNQVEYSLLHRQPETNGMLDACRELGVTLIAYQPLAMGALTGKYSGGARARGMRRFLPYFSRGRAGEVGTVVNLLREIGGRYEKSPAQVALRWLIEHDGVMPIPGAKNSTQAASNAAALTFALTPEEVQALNEVSAG